MRASIPASRASIYASMAASQLAASKTLEFERRLRQDHCQSVGGPGRRVEEACPTSRSPGARERKDLASVTLGRAAARVPRVWVAIRAAGGCPKAVRSMPSQEYVFDPQLKRVVSQDKVDKQKDWLTATTEGLSRAGADALDAAGQSINLAPAAHRRHESTPEVHADDEVEEDDYAPLFPATTQALDEAVVAAGDRVARTRRWLFPRKSSTSRRRRLR